MSVLKKRYAPLEVIGLWLDKGFNVRELFSAE
jgi:hypothetical protein